MLAVSSNNYTQNKKYEKIKIDACHSSGKPDAMHTGIGKSNCTAVP